MDGLVIGPKEQKRCNLTRYQSCYAQKHILFCHFLGCSLIQAHVGNMDCWHFGPDFVNALCILTWHTEEGEQKSGPHPDGFPHLVDCSLSCALKHSKQKKGLSLHTCQKKGSLCDPRGIYTQSSIQRGGCRSPPHTPS